MMTPLCRCGEPATHTLAYVWDGEETRRADVCDRHYEMSLDLGETLTPLGLRVLVLA